MHRTPEIQIDKIGGNPIDHLLGSLRHVSGVGTEELNPKRSLASVEVEIFTGTLIASKDAFGRDEFGNQNVCAVSLADLAKNLVGHTRHRGEIKREGILEPGERGIHSGNSLTKPSKVQVDGS